jgi:hypothetical protein
VGGSRVFAAAARLISQRAALAEEYALEGFLGVEMEWTVGAPKEGVQGCPPDTTRGVAD